MMIMLSNGWRLTQVAGTLISLLFHLLIAWLLLVGFPEKVLPTPPAAVMLEFASEIQVSQIINAPPGVNQQRRSEESQASEEKTTREVSLQTTKQVTVKEDTPLVVAAQGGELKARRQQTKTLKKRQHTTKAQSSRPAVAGNSMVTSRASPPVQNVVTRHTAAPMESDTSSQQTQSLLSWEALVKAKINRVKMYPEDAEQRGRSGSAQVSFTVNAQGKVTDSRLRRSSGTISLDRAALAAVRNAQPLPAPPPELLNLGVHKVIMPVNFTLSQRAGTEK